MSSQVLAITSGVISAGLLIAWGITTGVVQGTASSRSKRLQDRDAILKPILPKKEFVKVQINDSLNEGKIDAVTANLLMKAADSASSVEPNVQPVRFGTKGPGTLRISK